MLDGHSMPLDAVPKCVRELRRLVGNAVFLPCNTGEGGKGPILTKWQRLSPLDMTPGAIRQCERPEYRIGVGLGQQSNGVCGIDCDCQNFFADLCDLNPCLRETLTTQCNRGAMVWIKAVGSWPVNKPLYRFGHPVGEWRASGNQSVIAGRDPDTGNWRRFVVKAPALEIAFDDLRWPGGLTDRAGAPWPANAEREAADHTIKDVEQAEQSRILVLHPKGRAAQERAEKQNRLYHDLAAHLATGPGHRNALITSAVSFLYRAVAEPLVVAMSMRYFDEVGKPSGWGESRQAHRIKVEQLLKGLPARYFAGLTAAQAAIYGQLRDDRERAAFRICLDCACRDDRETGGCGPGELAMAYGELAARLDCGTSVAYALLLRRFSGDLRFMHIKTPGTKRRKGERAVATIWHFLPRLLG